MKAKITQPDGAVVEVDALPSELERLAATPGYMVQLLGPTQPPKGRPFFYNDLRRDPVAKA